SRAPLKWIARLVGEHLRLLRLLQGDVVVERSSVGGLFVFQDLHGRPNLVGAERIERMLCLIDGLRWRAVRGRIAASSEAGGDKEQREEENERAHSAMLASARPGCQLGSR